MSTEFWDKTAGQHTMGTNVCLVCGSIVWWKHYETHEEWHKQIEELAAVSLARTRQQI